MTGTQLFQRLRTSLAEVLGFEPSFDRLAQILGENTNVTHYWFNVLPHIHLIAFLTLLERLPEPKRVEWVSRNCRELASLDSPRLAHDPLALSKLEGLLRLTQGVTLIRGGTEFQRTFLLTALGHSLPRIQGPHAAVSGLDLHEPRKWVPLERLVYFKEPLPPGRVRELITQFWPQIRSADGPLILLNSIWSAAPALHQEILGLAQDRHVVVADARMPDPGEMAERIEASVQVVTIASAREHERWIRVEVEVV